MRIQLFLTAFCLFALGGQAMGATGEYPKKPKNQTQIMVSDIPEAVLRGIGRLGEKFVRLFSGDQVKAFLKSPGSDEVQKFLSSQNQPARENDFLFYNDPEDWDHYAPKTIGYCRGFANLGRILHQRVIFGQTSYQGNPEFNAIKKRLKKAIKGNIVEIPEFLNLTALAQTSDGEKILRDLVIQAWTEKTYAFDTVGMIKKMSRQAKDPERNKKFSSELEARLSLGFNSIIYFSLDPTHTPPEKMKSIAGIKTPPFIIHVVEAYKMEYVSSEVVRFWIWDRNYPPDQITFIEANLTSGELVYPAWIERYPWGKGVLSDIGFPREDAVDVQITAGAWKKWLSTKNNISRIKSISCGKALDI